MIHLRLAKKNRESDESAFDAVYGDEITKRIRRRYNINQELAILRQRDSKPDEYAAYDEYAEQCKAEVKALLGGKNV